MYASFLLYSCPFLYLIVFLIMCSDGLHVPEGITVLFIPLGL